MEDKKIILVIEDEDALQDAIRIKLESAGYQVVSATTAEEAFELLATVHPDLIWLDLLLPGMGGFQFLEQVRKDTQWRDLPVIVVSVSASPEKIQRAFQLNVIDYIVKSQYRLEDIIKKINNLLVKNGSVSHTQDVTEKLN
jgi:CheY-like chemotaxis protein